MQAVACQSVASGVVASGVVSMGDCYNERCHGVNGHGAGPGRRTTVSPMTDPDPGTVGTPPTVIRVACIVLLVVGLGSVLISLPALADPAGARCHLARARIDATNTDTKAWNNVDTGGPKGKDLPLPEALPLGGQCPPTSKGTRHRSGPTPMTLPGPYTMSI